MVALIIMVMIFCFGGVFGYKMGEKETLKRIEEERVNKLSGIVKDGEIL